MAMTTDSKSFGEQEQDGRSGDNICYEGGLDLAEAGRHEEALEIIEKAATFAPNDQLVLGNG